MAFVAAATLGAGLLGAGASIYAANKSSQVQQDAAARAAGVNTDALNLQRENLGIQRQNYGEMRGNLDPFIRSGQGANNLLSSAYGLNGEPARANVLQQFQNSPDYQFALKGGSDALDNSAAARGGMIGGNQIRAQTEYGSGLATQNLQNYLTRLTGMSQQGQTAGGYLGQVGSALGNGAAAGISATANNVGNDYMAGGTAQAAGINGMVKGLDSGLNSLSLYSQMGKSSYGGGTDNNYPSGGHH